MLTLYMDAMSQPSRAVALLLRANNIDFQQKILSIAKNEQRSEEFKKINPNRKIPAIDDDGFRLFESHAILRYLAQKDTVAEHWYPKDSQKRAMVDQYLDWHHTYTRSAAGYFVQTYLLPKVFKITPDEKKQAEALKTLQYSLKTLDSFFLQNTQYISSNQPTIADLSASCELMQLQVIKFDFSPYPKVAKWLSDVRSNVKGFDDVHAILYKVRDRVAAEAASDTSSGKSKL